MPAESIETLVIGGGQAGVIVSHMLARQARPHLVLERDRIAESWRTRRWDGLHFQGPAWSVRLPDFPLDGPDPFAYPTATQIADFIAAYATRNATPIRCGVPVTALRRHPSQLGFLAETPTSTIHAANVIVATGPFQRPVVPDLLPATPGILQLHSSQYRNPAQLPPGAVLVVGAGNSGTQIAEELLRAGRPVFQAIGRHRRVPRQYRNRNLHWWLKALGIEDTPTEKRNPDRSPMVLTGAYGGHTIDFRRLAAQGLTLLGRVQSAQDGILTIAPGLHDSIAHGDAAYLAFLDSADRHIASHALDLPPEPNARYTTPDPPALSDPPILRLDLHANTITTVLWATGYAPDFTWIDIPVFTPQGQPIHRQGITDIPGLYFLGLPYLSKFGSSFLSGIAEDAERLATHITAQPGRSD